MIADDDPTAQRLREAVWADPVADAPRMVLADYLLEHDDPLGELIALQLERARVGNAITPRELELVGAHGRRMLGPLEIWLLDWVLSRGFLAAARPASTMPTEVAHHPSWSTVDELAMWESHAVLDNPALRARTLHASTEVCLVLARRTAALPFRALSGAAPHVGLFFDGAAGDLFDHAGAFANVKALGAMGPSLQFGLEERPGPASRFLQQLEHLDLMFAHGQLDAIRTWHRRWAETMAISRFSVHAPLGYRSDTPGEYDESVWSPGPTHQTYFEIDRAGDQVVIQLEHDTGATTAANAIAIVAELAGDRTRVRVEDLRDATRVAERHPELIAGLRTRFAEVALPTGPTRRRAP